MSDSATWVAVGLAVGAASLALVAAVVVLLVVVRGRRSSYAAVEQLLRDSLQRTEGLHGDLTAALEEARTETRRARELGEIGDTIDLDAVLMLTVEAAGASTGVDAGLIRLPGPDGGEPLFATLGMSTDEAFRQPSPARRAVSLPAPCASATRTPMRRSATRATSSAAAYQYLCATRKASRSALSPSSGAARSAKRPTRSWPLSRSSPRVQGRRSRTRAASGTPANSPISTR